MLALALRAGPHRFAVPATQVIRVLQRCRLRSALLAPPAVSGLLPYHGGLAPIVDLCQLVLGRASATRRSTRIVLVAIGGAEPRVIGLLAEDVLDLIDVDAPVFGLRLPEQPWLGEHAEASLDAAQLIDPALLLPDALARLFRRGDGGAIAGAGGPAAEAG